MLELGDQVAGKSNQVIARRRLGTRDAAIQLIRRGSRKSLR
jgi:hypothetical protein